jgi:nicotinate-nucleotide pyrophosphorylase (carboxylating)
MSNGNDLTVVEEAMARLAILEDVGEGDITAELIPAAVRAVATVRAKEEGVLSGTGAAREVFRAVDPGLEVDFWLEAGDSFRPGDRILGVRGGARCLLTAERSVLNFLQHLSGVASLTARFVAAVGGTGVRISDTRKTVPGLRLLEKEAVRHGGGVNHRLGLYDAIMIKDNHIEAAGGIAAAVGSARAAHPDAPIIVEASNLREAEEAARLDVGRILLDNMAPEQAAQCMVAIRAIERSLPALGNADGRWLPDTWRAGDGRIQIEVSGGITLETARLHALPGVDFLSVGELTHSAPACDLAMDLDLIG